MHDSTGVRGSHRGDQRQKHLERRIQVEWGFSLDERAQRLALQERHHEHQCAVLVREGANNRQEFSAEFKDDDVKSTEVPAKRWVQRTLPVRREKT
jgi:hypothetical protein